MIENDSWKLPKNGVLYRHSTIVRVNAQISYIIGGGEKDLNHTQFIKALQDALVDEGIRISQDKLKTIFEVMADVILDNIEEEEKILIHQFLCFKLVDVKPRLLPDKTFSQPSLSMKVSLSEKYKKTVKDKLNN